MKIVSMKIVSNWIAVPIPGLEDIIPAEHSKHSLPLGPNVFSLELPIGV